MFRKIVTQKGVLIIIDSNLAIILEMTGSTLAAYGGIGL